MAFVVSERPNTVPNDFGSGEDSFTIRNPALSDVKLRLRDRGKGREDLRKCLRCDVGDEDDQNYPDPHYAQGRRLGKVIP